MKYFKKLSPMGLLEWTAELEHCSDKNAIEISKEEYDTLNNNSIEPDIIDIVCE